MIQTVEPDNKIEIGIKNDKLVSMNWGDYIHYPSFKDARENKKKQLIAVLKNAIKIVKQVKV